MAILDNALTFDTRRACPTDTSAHDSANVLDMGGGQNEFGRAVPGGGMTTVVFHVNETFSSSGSLAFSVALWDSADGASFAKVCDLCTNVPKASLVRGYEKRVGFMARRFTKLVYTCGTAGSDGGGNFSAWIESVGEA